MIDMSSVIFTNGAFIAPAKMASGKWMWVIVQFEDDCFLDGGIVYPEYSSNTLEELRQYETEEENYYDD